MDGWNQQELVKTVVNVLMSLFLKPPQSSFLHYKNHDNCVKPCLYQHCFGFEHAQPHRCSMILCKTKTSTPRLWLTHQLWHKLNSNRNIKLTFSRPASHFKLHRVDDDCCHTKKKKLKKLLNLGVRSCTWRDVLHTRLIWKCQDSPSAIFNIQPPCYSAHDYLFR